MERRKPLTCWFCGFFCVCAPVFGGPGVGCRKARRCSIGPPTRVRVTTLLGGGVVIDKTVTGAETMNIDTNSHAGRLVPVDHDDFRQTVQDAVDSYRAVSVLVGLLNGESEASLSVTDRAGLAVLLAAIEQRMALAVDGLGVTAKALGLPDAWELVH